MIHQILKTSADQSHDGWFKQDISSLLMQTMQLSGAMQDNTLTTMATVGVNLARPACVIRHSTYNIWPYKLPGTFTGLSGVGTVWLLHPQGVACSAWPLWSLWNMVYSSWGEGCVVLGSTDKVIMCQAEQHMYCTSCHCYGWQERGKTECS